MEIFCGEQSCQIPGKTLNNRSKGRAVDYVSWVKALALLILLSSKSFLKILLKFLVKRLKTFNLETVSIKPQNNEKYCDKIVQPQKYAPKEKSALIRKKMSPPIQRKRVTIERKEKLFIFFWKDEKSYS